MIGVTCDVSRTTDAAGRERVRLDAGLAYSAAIFAAGGQAVMLPPIIELIDDQLSLCDGFVLTGGDDPRTEEFGAPTHPEAKPMDPLRQRYETALLRALLSPRADSTPAIGVCLGMQMMALAAGGRLDQHMPESLGVAIAGLHRHNAAHTLESSPGAPAWLATAARAGATVVSHHRQAVIDAGQRRVIARSSGAAGAVIEAIDAPSRPALMLGVQWHPERTEDRALGIGVFEQLVRAAAGSRLRA
ncbi:MAG: gamma-glutamyl-gamma-aminobutyrate hydrolase family protein [Phycisphaerales bacterium]